MGKAHTAPGPLRELRDPVPTSDAKVFNLTRDEVKALGERLGKCIDPATGEPVSARKDASAVFPVKGSVVLPAPVPGVEGSKGGTGTGTCPHCGAHVRLSVKGAITSHTVRRTSVPVVKARLKERQSAVTETGSRVGSPDASERTRTAELAGATGTEPVKIKMTVRDPETGAEKTQPVDVPPTPENIRTALRQEYRKKNPDSKLTHRLGAMLRGATGLQAAPVLGAEPGTYRVFEAVTLDAPCAEERKRDDGSVAHVPTSPGPALVKGPSMSGAVPTERARVTKGGKPRNAIGWGGPLGRERVDPFVSSGTLRDKSECQGTDCGVPGCVAVIGGQHGYLSCADFRVLSKNKRRRYWAHVKITRDRAEAAKAQRARPVVPGTGYVSREPVNRAGIQRV